MHKQTKEVRGTHTRALSLLREVPMAQLRTLWVSKMGEIAANREV